jgi:hypothetical protein
VAQPTGPGPRGAPAAGASLCPALPRHAAPRCRALRDAELAALDREFDEHYEDICDEEAAREGLRAELGPGADGRDQAADEPPPPVTRVDDDDTPPALDLGVERISLDPGGVPAPR